jgi:branched-subunit amino acid ABC-type transport system permease component
MSILPREFFILYTAIVLAIVFICALVAALLLNLTLRTRWYRLVISSALIAVVANEATTFIGNVTLPPLRWFNDVPLDTRTATWDRLGIISITVALICFAVWQFAIRRTRRFRLSNATQQIVGPERGERVSQLD